MMYPDTIEQKLGFLQIRQLLLQYCKSPLGKNFVTKLKPSNKLHQVQLWLGQVAELQNAIEQGLVPAMEEFNDIEDVILNAAVAGAVLSIEQLVALKQTLQVGHNTVQFSKELDKTAYPKLRNLVKDVVFPEAVLDQLLRILEPDGSIKDNATPALLELRNSFKHEQNKLRSIVQKAYKQAKNEGFVPDGSTISVRENRMVIPVHAANKRHVKGFVHDESSSGTIAYIEPVESLEANNKLRELELAERREIYKILTQVTEQVREQLPPIGQLLHFMGIMDFIWAKAKVAQYLNGNLPMVTSTLGVKLLDARHPQLVIALHKEERQVVPLTLELTRQNHLLLISGPNAGGKSVALKTIGINQYMLQCGLLPLVGADSKMCIFKDIFIDIGDEQSIDNDLSTYSSHLFAMRIMLKKGSRESLLLIDEFGTGTDPLFGGAIAEAMLEKFVNNQCFGAITTHYSNLKAFAEKTPGISNGAMQFDMQKLEPLYKLLVGRPGSSFALELAQKTGVQGEIIKAAKEKMGTAHLDIEKLLNKLERQKQDLKNRETALKQNENKVKQLEEKYTELQQSLARKKASILEKARAQAASLLQNTNREIEKTIRHIKESKAEKKETRKVRESLHNYAQKLESTRTSKNFNKKQKALPGIIVKGDFVVLDDGNAAVEVLDVNGNEIKIGSGSLVTFVNKNRLTKVGKSATIPAKRNSASLGNQMLSKKASFSATLDVRGKYSNEVLQLVDAFLNDALLVGQTELKILHGKGNGVLREMIRQQLREYSFVRRFEDAPIDHGGAGITLITIE